MPDTRCAECGSLPMFALAHDLRHPLRLMVATVQRVMRQEGAQLPEETRAQLNGVIAAARQQDELLSAAVEYEAAGNPDRVATLPLSALIQAACWKVDAYRKARGGVITGPAGASPTQVPAAAVMALEKVLHNALKYQQPGGRPEVRLEAEETEEGEVAIRVSDNGVGIETAYREKIFEPLTRLHARSEFEGFGLGLATARRLLIALGGSIAIEDQMDPRVRGCTFLIRFPISGS